MRAERRRSALRPSDQGVPHREPWCRKRSEQVCTWTRFETAIMSEMLDRYKKMSAVAISAVAVGGAATAGVPAAHADDFNGKYGFRAGVGGAEFSSVWTVTPCGEGCVHIVSSTGGTDTDAYRDGRYWVFDRIVDPGIECPPSPYNFQRRKLPATMRFTINADSLAGQYQPVGTPCGAVSLPSPFQLEKIGS